MERPLCADDFAAIRARLKELHAERLQVSAGEPPLPAIDRPAEAPQQSRTGAARPGIPGWRVARRKRAYTD